MNSMQFTQAISRIWVLETRLLDKAKIERLIESKSADDALKVLRDTEYSNVMSDVKRAADYEEILSLELKRVYKLVYELCPVKEIVDLMSIKYEYHNLKTIIKGKLLKKDFSSILIDLGRDNLDEIKRKIELDNYKGLKPSMQKATKEVMEVFEATKDPQKIDIIIDKHMFNELVKIKKSLDYGFTDKIINTLIDLTNVKTLLRIQRQGKGREFASEVLVDGGTILKSKLLSLINESPENIMNKLSFSAYSNVLKEGIQSYIDKGSLNYLEKLSDNYMMKVMKDSKFVTFGPERILTYTYAKETEIKIIRIIMVGKLNNIAEEVIRERLRDIYV
ncbi:MAG: V-type ATP synthase subunit C [Clostridium sp.]